MGFLKLILFWIRLVISHAYQPATDEDCRAVKVKMHSRENRYFTSF